MLQTLTVVAVLGAAGPVPTPSATSPRPVTADKEKFIAQSCVPAEHVGPFVELPRVARAQRALGELTAAYRLISTASEVMIRSHSPEPEVVVRGSVGTHARVTALVADLDRERPAFHLTTTVLQVNAEFLTASGLIRPGTQDRMWVLNERELGLFNLALRHYPDRAVLSRPQMQMTEGQTGSVQVGQDVPAGPGAAPRYVPTGFTAHITPRLSADGKAMLLRVESQLTTVNMTAVAGVTAFPRNVQTVETTAVVPTGSTTVLSMPTTGDDGKPAAVLFVVTPTVRP